MPLACSGTDVEVWGTVSATWPEAVRRLANSYLRDPVRITVGSDDLTANSRVAQGALPTAPCGL
jgi:superfamily II DNA/RNA helicase